ncbi:MAG: hypothetical protein JO243_13215 [Solirubrobacterales bacterium]|nr:hypothetical protein [Solirubrobacterales bacterium]
MTATRTAEYRHTPALPANFESNVHQLPGGNVFLGWGQQPYFAEFDSRGQAILDGRSLVKTANYRAYTFSWKAAPGTPPAVGALNRGGKMAVYVSWNGATEVTTWRILASDAPTSLSPIVTAEKHGFETEVEIGAHPMWRSKRSTAQETRSQPPRPFSRVDRARLADGKASATATSRTREGPAYNKSVLLGARRRCGAPAEWFNQPSMGLSTHTGLRASVRRCGHRQRSTSELESTTGNDSQVTPPAARRR